MLPRGDGTDSFGVPLAATGYGDIAHGPVVRQLFGDREPVRHPVAPDKKTRRVSIFRCGGVQERGSVAKAGRITGKLEN